MWLAVVVAMVKFQHISVYVPGKMARVFCMDWFLCQWNIFTVKHCCVWSWDAKAMHHNRVNQTSDGQQSPPHIHCACVCVCVQFYETFYNDKTRRHSKINKCRKQNNNEIQCAHTFWPIFPKKSINIFRQKLVEIYTTFFSSDCTKKTHASCFHASHAYLGSFVRVWNSEFHNNIFFPESNLTELNSYIWWSFAWIVVFFFSILHFWFVKSTIKQRRKCLLKWGFYDIELEL